jgi:NADH-quinone oxidoreductase subunit J
MIGTILFVIVAVVAVLAAIGMLTSTNAVHAALFLVINFACIALLYLSLDAPFLAMVQVTVYAGAIMVLFLFVIMLLGAEKVSITSRLNWQIPVAAILTVALIGVAAFTLFSPQVGVDLPTINAAEVPASSAETGFEYGSPQSVGALLFNLYLLPFELTGVLLLVAMVGAIVLTRDEGKAPAGKRRRAEVTPEAEKVSGD